jgi:hypothetical protein
MLHQKISFITVDQKYIKKMDFLSNNWLKETTINHKKLM